MSTVLAAPVGIIGRSKYEIDTPALLIDLDAVDRNIALMSRRIFAAGVNWRPHTKGQKVPALVYKEIQAGAIGITCAKLGEAEVMAGAGIRDILIANQVVGPTKIARLVNLLRHADVMVAVDSIENIAELSEAAAAKGVTLRVLIEINIGLDRSGLEEGEEVVSLARKILSMPGLRFVGLMGWEGNCCRAENDTLKRACVESSVGKLIRSAERCRAAGIPVEIVSCGGTGTYWITSTIPGVTEIQAGGGILHDILYETDFRIPGHEFALTMMTTVVSRPNPTRIVTDAGRKTMSIDLAIPRPLIDNVASVRLSAEHGRVELSQPNTTLKVGDRLEFIVGYSDLTVFLHDEIYGIRDGTVEVVWPVQGRGKIR